MNKAAAVCFVFILMASGLSAQDARGRITGRVQDPSGAPVPRATVEAMQTETRVRTTATTNDSGA